MNTLDQNAFQMNRLFFLVSISLFLIVSGGANAADISRIEPSAYRGVFAPTDPLAWAVTLHNDAAAISPAASLKWSISDVTGTELITKS